jgi:hypothetical protein
MKFLCRIFGHKIIVLRVPKLTEPKGEYVVCGCARCGREFLREITQRELKGLRA